MKESKLYINFFRKNLVIILPLMVISAIIGFTVYANKPTLHITGALYELNYTQENIQNKVLEADQAITLVRSVNTREGLGINSDINSFKSGPLALRIEVLSGDQNTSRNDANRVKNFLFTKYDLSQVGQFDLSQRSEVPLVGFIIGAAIGGLAGLLISLTREYLTKY